MDRRGGNGYRPVDRRFAGSEPFGYYDSNSVFQWVHAAGAVAEFSFFMVIIPILGEALLNVMDMASGESAVMNTIGWLPLTVGFVASFVSGCAACKWMIEIVKRGKLVWFAVYCVAMAWCAYCGDNHAGDGYQREKDFVEGEILAVDKPLGRSSFDVVKRLRGAVLRRLGVKRFKGWTRRNARSSGYGGDDSGHKRGNEAHRAAPERCEGVCGDDSAWCDHAVV